MKGARLRGFPARGRQTVKCGLCGMCEFRHPQRRSGLVWVVYAGVTDSRVSIWGDNVCAVLETQRGSDDGDEVVTDG